MKLFTCKCCGFKTLDSQNNYDICDVCDWEDDPIQYNNPHSNIGANKINLYNYQLEIVLRIPLTVDNLNGFIRDKNWKPFDKDVINKNQINNGLDYFNNA